MKLIQETNPVGYNKHELKNIYAIVSGDSLWKNLENR